MTDEFECGSYRRASENIHHERSDRLFRLVTQSYKLATMTAAFFSLTVSVG